MNILKFQQPSTLPLPAHSNFATESEKNAGKVMYKKCRTTLVFILKINVRFVARVLNQYRDRPLFAEFSECPENRSAGGMGR